MRRYFPAALVLALMLWLASASIALKKTAVRATDIERAEGWNVQTECTVAYCNYCTGWMWAWSGWGPNEIIGVCYDCCCTNPDSTARLNITWELVRSTAPAGYGFTGIIEVWDPVNTVIDCCPVVPLAGAPFHFRSGWNGHYWGMAVPCLFVVTVTFGPGLGTPSAMLSDRPAGGPTGPQACGYCYPHVRTCHSFYYGTPMSPLCPGSSLTDGVCCAEWVWDVWLFCDVAVKDDSWGNIKALYR
jgi:hypothetical protein